MLSVHCSHNPVEGLLQPTSPITSYGRPLLQSRHSTNYCNLSKFGNMMVKLILQEKIQILFTTETLSEESKFSVQKLKLKRFQLRLCGIGPRPIVKSIP